MTQEEKENKKQLLKQWLRSSNPYDIVTIKESFTHYCVKTNNIEAVKLYCLDDDYMDKTTIFGENVYHYAIKYRHIDMFRFLFELRECKNIYQNTDAQSNILNIAIDQNSNFKFIKLLLETCKEFDLDIKKLVYNKDGDSCITTTVNNARDDILELFRDKYDIVLDNYLEDIAIAIDRLFYTLKLKNSSININSTLKELKPIFEKDNVKLLGLFGSYARNEAKEDSDIDILIETTPIFLENNRGFSAFSKLDELRKILKESFGKDIDIVDKQGLIANNNSFILDRTIYV